MKTTLNQIRECDPCPHGWQKLLAHLGKTKADARHLMESGYGPEEAVDKYLAARRIQGAL